ncbi:MAG: polysaccharide biosynthesis C-terminal domain-containing protein, partial [Paludibacter sp.]
LGISIYGQKEIAKIRDDRNKLSKTFLEIFLLNSTCSLIVFVIIIGYIYFFAQYKNLFLIQSIILLLSSLDISWFYQGMEKFKINLYRNIAAKSFSLLFLFLFVKTENDLWIYTTLYVGSIIIGNIYMWFGINKYITFSSHIKLSIKKHLSGSIKLFYIFFLGIVSINVSKTVIGSMISMVDLGKYDIIYKIITITLVLSTNIGTVLLPRMAYLFSVNNQTEIQNYLKKSINISTFLSFGIMFGLIAVSKNLITLYLGSKFQDAYILLYILSPMIAINTLSNVFSMQYLIPTNQEKKYTFSLIGGLIAGIMSLFILTPIFSTYGACMSVVISELTILSLHIFQLRKDLDTKNLLREILPNMFSAVGMFIIILAINWIPIAIIPKIIIQIGIGIIVYLSFNYAIGNTILFSFFKNVVTKIPFKFENEKARID